MNKILLYLTVFTGLNISAQQIPLNSLYIYNLYQVNPSVVGKDEGAEINMSHRQQWVGLSL